MTSIETKAGVVKIGDTILTENGFLFDVHEIDDEGFIIGGIHACCAAKVSRVHRRAA